MEKVEAGQRESWYAIARRAAVEAGAAIMKIYDAPIEVEYKADDSPLTKADQEADDLICAQLAETNIPVLSEEGAKASYEERRKWTRCWIVDPLDGTKEFIKRNGEFTVNIALCENGEVVFGVVYAPAKQLLYYAAKETGAFRSLLSDPVEKQNQRLPLFPLPAVFTVVGSRSHSSPETEAYIKTLEQQHGQVDFAASGSSLKFCLLAEGRAHSYPRFAPTMEWDTAAGQAVLEIAGGKVVVQPSGEPLRYNREALLNPWFLATAPGV